MKKFKNITISAPCKVHLLGEWAVVWGKPAILIAVDLRTTVILSPKDEGSLTNVRTPNKLGDSSLITQNDIRKIIEPIVKKYLKIKTIPPYHLTINSKAPIGSGLGSSAAISASYIAALLSFLKNKWDLDLIYKLTFEAEKTFHGNPSGGDNSTVVYGGLIWFRKESPDLRIIQPLPFTIPPKLAKNFIFINTGKPKETTKDMVEMVSARVKGDGLRVKKIFDEQERLVKELVPVLKEGNEKELIRIIREGEKNLESIGVVPNPVSQMIRQIEQIGGAAKISGAGGKKGPAGIILAYHPNKAKLLKVIKSDGLPFFATELGVEGLRKE